MRAWTRRLIGLAVVCAGIGMMAMPAVAQQPAGEAEGGGRLLREQQKPGAGIPSTATEQPAGQAEGAGRLTREQEAPAAHICAGCLAPMFSEGGKGSITPYGRVELDAIYSNRNTNPLDPGQFNGYLTAAGKSSNGSSTLNPRYSVFGLRADRTDGKHSLKGVVEVDFYSQTSVTAGMDWTPIMAAPGSDRLLDHGLWRKSLAASSTDHGSA